MDEYAVGIDISDFMCPNCVTPWKCNGPHLLNQTPAALSGRVRAVDPYIGIGEVQDQIDWSIRTFGPGERNAGLADHIIKELQEIEDAESNEEAAKEWTDVLILAIDGMQRCGMTAEQIIDSYLDKMQVNYARKWPDPNDPKFAGKAIEHIRE